jgi:hypothetical protein
MKIEGIDWRPAYESLADSTRTAVDSAAEEAVRTLQYHGFTYLHVHSDHVAILRDAITCYLLVSPEGGH